MENGEWSREFTESSESRESRIEDHDRSRFLTYSKSAPKCSSVLVRSAARIALTFALVLVIQSHELQIYFGTENSLPIEPTV